MSNAAVRAAWKAGVFDHDDVQAITPNAFQFDAVAHLESKSEAIALFEDAEVNAFQYLVSRTREENEVGGAAIVILEDTYTVEVTYTREKDTEQDDQNYNVAVDALDTVVTLALTELGRTWGGTVEFWRQTAQVRPRLALVDGRECWQCSATFEGVQKVSL